MDMWKGLISNKDTKCFTCKWRDTCANISMNKLYCSNWFYGDPKEEEGGEESYSNIECGHRYAELASDASQGKNIKKFEEYYDTNCKNCIFMHEICMYGEED